MVGRGCILSTSEPHPQEAAVQFLHPARRWETQSQNMNSKVISPYACKVHRDVVGALAVNPFSLKDIGKIKAEHGLFLFKQTQEIVSTKPIFLINCCYDVRAVKTPQMIAW